MSKKKVDIDHEIDKMRVQAAIALQQYRPKVFPKKNAHNRNKIKEETFELMKEVDAE